MSASADRQIRRRTDALDVVVLAAGLSQRMGRDKLRMRVAGRELLEWTMAIVARELPGSRRIVVGGEHLPSPAWLAQAGATLSVAHDAAQGLHRSLAAGLRAVDARSDAAVIVLADDPLAARALSHVCDRAREEPHAPVVAVRRTKSAPHPVLLRRSVWGVLGGAGLPALLADPGVVWVEAPHAPSCDVDHPGDVRALEELLEGLEL